MRTLRTLTVPLLVLALLVFDVAEIPARSQTTPVAEPVAPVVETIPVDGVDARAEDAVGDASMPDALPSDVSAAGVTVDDEPEVLTAPVETEDEVGVIGVTWDADSLPATGAVVSVRVREDGDWTEWEVLDPVDGGPDAGSPDALNASGVAATEPYLSTGADAVQVRVDTGDGDAPDGVEVVAIDPGESPADDVAATTGPLTSASAASAPAVVTRSQWGADERLRNCTPSSSSTLKAGVVHHTAGTNSYSASQSRSLVRGIYAYHAGTLGWCDTGYNFLVDKYGQVFEGRYGSVARAVRGAHAGGFNADTIGVAAMGNYDTVGTTAAMIEGIARVLAWKLGEHYADPTGTTRLTSAGGGTAKYSAGTTVTVPVIMGHRDLGHTACPGRYLYSQLGAIEDRVLQLMGPGLVGPSITGTRVVEDSTVTVTAKALTSQTWTMRVWDQCRAAVVASRTGTVSRGGTISAAWDLASAGDAGQYTVTLTPRSGSASGRAKTWPVTVTAPTRNPPALGAASAPGAGTFVALPPSRILDTRQSRDPLGPGSRRDVPVLGRGGVPSTGVTAVALNVTSTCASSSGSSYLTVWPAGQARPLASSLNTTPADTTAGHVVSAVGAGGAVSVYNDTGATQLVVDVVGYYTSGGGGSRLQPVPPTRVYDSRATGGPLANGQVRRVNVASAAGTMPAGSTAAVLNVTVAGATGQGFVTVYPAGQARPTASTVNHVPGTDVANRAVVALSGSAFDITLGGATAHVVVDLVGWYAPTGSGGELQPVAPTRVLDSRNGTGGVGGKVPAGTQRSIAVAGVAGVPADARAVVLTLTGDAATAPTFVTAWPWGTSRPTTSDLNLTPGRARANTVVVTVGSGGRIGLYNNAGSTHLIADVVGYFP